MRHTVKIAIVLLGGGSGFFLSDPADAQTIIVEKSTVGCQANRWTDITGTLNPVPGPGDPINVTGVDDTWTAVRVRTIGGAAQLGSLTLNGSRTGSVPLDVVLTTQDCIPQSPDTPVPTGAVSATSWSGLTFGAGSESVRDAVRLTAAISGDLTGSVDCGTVYRLQVGGAIKAPVTAHGAHIFGNDGHPAIAMIVAGDLSNNGTTELGSITAAVGSIGTIDAVGLQTGNIHVPISAPQGSITNLDFTRDGNVDQDDVAALINYVAGGGCP